MTELAKIALATYAYVFLVGIGLAVFKLALMAPRFEADNPLEVVSIRTTAPGWQSVGATAVSAAMSVAVLVLLLLVVAFLLTKLHLLVYVFFVGIVAMIAYQTLSLFNFRSRVRGWAGEREARVGQVLIALVVGSLWLILPSWFTYDLTAMLLLFNFAHTTGVVKLRGVLILCAMLVLFDVWGVWLSQLTVVLATGGSGGHPLPMLVMVPGSPWPWSTNYLAELGIGDIFVGSIMVLAFTPYRLEWWAAGGWCLGLAVALLLPFSWVPALLTLVPCIFVTTGAGWLWRRVSRRPQQA